MIQTQLLWKEINYLGQNDVNYVIVVDSNKLFLEINEISFRESWDITPKENILDKILEDFKDLKSEEVETKLSIFSKIYDHHMGIYDKDENQLYFNDNHEHYFLRKNSQDGEIVFTRVSYWVATDEKQAKIDLINLLIDQDYKYG